MAKFTYTGDMAEITLRGVTFPRNKAVSVADDDLAAKVAALDYFKRTAERKPKAKPDGKNDK